jgi:hypothetical protein
MKLVRNEKGFKFNNLKPFLIFVPGTGIEPALPCDNQILSLTRLPIPPSGLMFGFLPAYLFTIKDL